MHNKYLIVLMSICLIIDLAALLIEVQQQQWVGVGALVGSALMILIGLGVVTFMLIRDRQPL